MAGLLVLPAVFAYDKIKKSKQRRVDRRAHNDARFTELEKENSARIAALQSNTCFCQTSDWTGGGCDQHGYVPPAAERDRLAREARQDRDRALQETNDTASNRSHNHNQHSNSNNPYNRIRDHEIASDSPPYDDARTPPSSSTTASPRQRNGSAAFNALRNADLRRPSMRSNGGGSGNFVSLASGGAETSGNNRRYSNDGDDGDGSHYQEPSSVAERERLQREKINEARRKGGKRGWFGQKKARGGDSLGREYTDGVVR